VPGVGEGEPAGVRGQVVSWTQRAGPAVGADHGVGAVARIVDEERAAAPAAGEELLGFEGTDRVRQVDAFPVVPGAAVVVGPPDRDQPAV
jgi:hypothetical protein